MADSPASLRGALVAAAPHDPDAFRAYLANRSCLKLQRELEADSIFIDRILELARQSDSRPPPGPDRDQLLRLLTGSLTAA
jgi:hypothetical protein